MRIFTLFFVSVLLFSCKQNDNIDGINESDRFKAAVYLSAGDNYPLFNKSGTPTFFNLGRIIKPENTNHNTIILSERKSKGTKLNILPLASLSFNEDTVRHHYIISTLDHEDYSYLNNTDKDFLVDHLELQSNLENWFLSQCAEFKCREFKWENKYQTLLKLQNNTNK